MHCVVNILQYTCYTNPTNNHLNNAALWMILIITLWVLVSKQLHASESMLTVTVLLRNNGAYCLTARSVLQTLYEIIAVDFNDLSMQREQINCLLSHIPVQYTVVLFILKWATIWQNISSTYHKVQDNISLIHFPGIYVRALVDHKRDQHTARRRKEILCRRELSHFISV